MITVHEFGAGPARSAAGRGHPRFDDDTAVAALDDGVGPRRRFSARVHEHWYVARGANGGLFAAQATRVLEALAPDPAQLPRSLTVHYLAAPVAGEVEWEATLERAGRSTSFVSMRVMTPGGEPLALALGAVATWRESDLAWQTAPPAVAAPESLRRFPGPGEEAIPLMRNYDLRPALGDPPMTGSDKAETGGWIRTARPRRLDAPLLAAYADAFAPAVFPRLTGPAFLPTIDLTIHWRAPIPADADPHPFVLGRFMSAQGGHGMFEEDGELWARDGTLLVQSRQLALLRTRV